MTMEKDNSIQFTLSGLSILKGRTKEIQEALILEWLDKARRDIYEAIEAFDRVKQ